MTDDIHDTEAWTAVVTFLFARVVGLVLLYLHPQNDIAPPVGRQLNTTVTTVPSGGRLPQNNPHPTHGYQTNHLVHSVATVRHPTPPPPPNYLEYSRDIRIDGPVPSYGNTGNVRARTVNLRASTVSLRASTVNVVPAPSTNQPPAENADLGGDEEGSNV
ncbi:hypothetical protein FS837_007715 [Tulasnella sp. UAMH 9824]|nr:hypothetical protein FS837_007715 [Tulasnella sp. UAMH 9824]